MSAGFRNDSTSLCFVTRSLRGLKHKTMAAELPMKRLKDELKMLSTRNLL